MLVVFDDIILECSLENAIALLVVLEKFCANNEIRPVKTKYCIIQPGSDRKSCLITIGSQQNVLISADDKLTFWLKFKSFTYVLKYMVDSQLARKIEVIKEGDSNEIGVFERQYVNPAEEADISRNKFEENTKTTKQVKEGNQNTTTSKNPMAEALLAGDVSHLNIDQLRKLTLIISKNVIGQEPPIQEGGSISQLINKAYESEDELLMKKLLTKIVSYLRRNRLIDQCIKAIEESNTHKSNKE